MAKDLVNSNGKQSYERKLEMKKDENLLKSKYNLEEKDDNNGYLYRGADTLEIGGSKGDDYFAEDKFIGYPLYNTYMIKMQSINGLSHFIDVRTKDAIYANNTIRQNNKTNEISTNFHIESEWGDLYEGVVKKDVEKHPLSIAESRIHGKINTLESGVTDTELKPVSETQFQMDKLESVEAIGEIGREEHSVPRTKAVIETRDGNIELEKQEKKSNVFGTNTIDVSKIKPASTGGSFGVTGEDSFEGNDSPTPVSGFILVGKYIEGEQDHLIDAIENVTDRDAVDAQEVIEKASGFLLVKKTENLDNRQLSSMDSMTKIVSKIITNSRGLILIGDFGQIQKDLKSRIEEVLPDLEFIYLSNEKGKLGQATNFALVRDIVEAENLDLMRSELKEASVQALNQSTSGSGEQGGSTFDDSGYGVIGRYYDGEQAKLEAALESVEKCVPPQRAIIGEKGTLCRVPPILQIGRIGRNDDYFKGVIEEI